MLVSLYDSVMADMQKIATHATQGHGNNFSKSPTKRLFSTETNPFFMLKMMNKLGLTWTKLRLASVS